MARQSIRVLDFIIRESGRHSDQYRRPFWTSTNDVGTINALRDRVENSITITPGTVAGTAAAILRPATDVEAAVDIPNGWDERRNTFMMVVEVDGGLQGNSREIIQGYTDFAGVDRRHAGNGAVIADETIFYINSIIQVKEITYGTPMGLQTQMQVTDNSHLICDNNFRSIYAASSLERIRPEDVYPLVKNRDASMFGSPGDYVDSNTRVTGVAVKSNRGNGESSNFLSKLLLGYKTASLENGWNGTQDEIFEAARTWSADPVAAVDPFLMALANVRNNIVNNNFEIRDLLQLDPRALERADLMTAGSISSRNTPYVACAGDGENWNGRGREHVAAAMLAQAIPAVMSKYGFLILNLQATNENFDRQHFATFGNYEGLVKGATSQLLDLMLSKIEQEILPDISLNNLFSYKLDMYCDLLGDSLIKISMDGDIEYEFSVPSFADALTVPIVTADLDRAFTIAGDLNTIIDHSIGNDAGMDRGSSRIISAPSGGFGRI